MTPGRALLGLVGTAVVVGGFATASVLARRRWFPAAIGPVRHLIEVVLGLSGVLAVALALGTVGAFDAIPLVVVAVGIGAAAVARLRTLPPPRTTDTAPPASRPARWTTLAVGGAVGLVAVRWIAELLQTVSRGFSHADELHYHLTHAALFVQSGETWPIRFTSIGDGAAYHPAHSELLHGIALAVVGSDFTSIFLNLGFAAMALTAAWVIGDRAGSAPAATLLVASVLSLPLIVSESGSTLNDTMAIALLLTAVAFLLDATDGAIDRPMVAMAGIAAGLAAGTKLTVLVPVVALTVVVVTRPGGERVRNTATYVGSAALAGGYWYVRNAAATGNPVPALSFGPLPGPDLEFQRAVEFSVLEYVTDTEIWRAFFVPGLEQFFGIVWPLLLGAVAVSGVLALTAVMWRSDRRWPVLALCGLVALASYVTTPTSAAGQEGAPFLFPFNLRYALPGLLLCGLAGLAHPLVRRHPTPVVAIAGAVFVASNLHAGDPRRSVVAIVLVAGLLMAAWVLARSPRLRVPAAVVVLVGGLVVGVAANDVYLDRRWSEDLARWSAFEAGDDARDTTIGLTGFPQSYPFFGADLSNRVVTLGDDASGDELVPYESCEAWWTAVTDADVAVVVVLTESALEGSDLGDLIIDAPTRWLEQAGAPAVFRGRDSTMFDVRSVAPACAG